MSFYIRINNPKVGRHASRAGEGATKVFLVSAFTAAINDVPNPYGPGFRRENLGVAVTLAGEGTEILPFGVDEFEDLVLDAQRKGKIVDFSSKNWLTLLDDLVAMRKTPPSFDAEPSIHAPEDPSIPSPDVFFASIIGPDPADDPRYDAIKRAQREFQEVEKRYGVLPNYDPRFRRAWDNMDRAVRDFHKSVRQEFRRAQLRSACQTLTGVWHRLTEPLMRTPSSPPFSQRPN